MSIDELFHLYREVLDADREIPWMIEVRNALRSKVITPLQKLELVECDEGWSLEWACNSLAHDVSSNFAAWAAALDHLVGKPWAGRVLFLILNRMRCCQASSEEWVNVNSDFLEVRFVRDAEIYKRWAERHDPAELAHPESESGVVFRILRAPVRSDPPLFAS